MYVEGKRVSEIQAYLYNNKCLTPTAMLIQRTGRRWGNGTDEFPYSWSDKAIYDMLVRREYLGHTYTSKSHKASYKIKKVVKHSYDEQHEFLNTHEALIDKKTFDLAQKRLATRNRVCKSDDVDLFSGLVFCADCRKRMYVQRGKGTPERKHGYNCGTYRNTSAKYNPQCSTHYIRKGVLMELVLLDIQRVCRYITENKKVFLADAKANHEQTLTKLSADARQEYQRLKTRLCELDTIFRRLYEDQIFGKIDETQFVTMTSNYTEERETLTAKISELERLLKQSDEQKNNAAAFVKIVESREFIDELDYEIVHEFIDKIYVYEIDKENCTREIEILYNYVGGIEFGEKPSNESYFRQGVGNGACIIKSIVT
ncbi:MAG: DUF4368 domain-containing protein [Oscillospiraceae bacterium]|nr:DUF4368 domain-containing protein [Oscillospiraceae bacterium]